MKVGQGTLVAAIGALLLIGCGVRLTHFKTDTRRQVVSSDDPLQKPLAAYMGAATSLEKLHVARQAQQLELAERPAPQPSTSLATGCLITKWGAIWLLNKRGERLHVVQPADGCELKAATVEADDLLGYPKAFDGGPGYTLSEADCKEACTRPACTGRGLAATAPTPTQTTASPAVVAPAKGWGLGPADGWMKQSPLRFNAIAIRAFAPGGIYHSLPPGQPLLLVFGGASVNDMMRNWALHVQKLQLPYIVTCMDETLFDLAGTHGLPAAIFQQASGAAGPGVVTTRWKYFRMDPAAFMTMGILKVRRRNLLVVLFL